MQTFQRSEPPQKQTNKQTNKTTTKKPSRRQGSAEHVAETASTIQRIRPYHRDTAFRQTCHSIYQLCYFKIQGPNSTDFSPAHLYMYRPIAHSWPRVTPVHSSLYSSNEKVLPFYDYTFFSISNRMKLSSWLFSKWGNYWHFIFDGRSQTSQSFEELS